jgi:hypothetical protein
MQLGRLRCWFEGWIDQNLLLALGINEVRCIDGRSVLSGFIFMLASIQIIEGKNACLTSCFGRSSMRLFYPVLS